MWEEKKGGENRRGNQRGGRSGSHFQQDKPFQSRSPVKAILDIAIVKMNNNTNENEKILMMMI